MPISTIDDKPGYCMSLFHQKCARCRTGNMFKTQKFYDLGNFMKMYENCPACGQFMEIEPGFYYGTSYVSYAITVALSCISFVLWWLTIGFSLTDNRLFWWIGINTIFLIVSQPFLMRLSRAIWLSFFVKYNPAWKTEKPEDPERK